jgi:hypothetical protein
MGLKEVLVLEATCDFCGETIPDGKARVGTLEARRQGARGRGERWEVAFHEACYKKMTKTATKARLAGAET